MTKAIGQRLFISTYTVSRHIRNLCLKLLAKNSVHLQVKSLKSEHVQVNHPVLTRRENQIMCLVMQGMNSEDIAHVLNISYATVRKHRENILLKLKVGSMRLAVANVLYLVESGQKRAAL